MRPKILLIVLLCLLFQIQVFSQQPIAPKNDAFLSDREILSSQQTDSLLHLTLLRADSVREEISKDAAFSFLFQEALRAKANEKYALGLKLLQECVKLDSTQADTYYELTPFFLSRNQKDSAFQSLKRAHEFNPGNYWYTLQLAQFYQTLEDYPNAIRLWEQLSEGKGEKSQIFFTLANLYLKTEDYSSALDALNRLESSIGKQEELSMAKARIHLAQDNQKLAIKEIQALIDSQNDNPHYPILLSDLYMTLGNPAKSYSTLKKNQKDYPNDSETLMALAEYYHRNNDTVNVDRCFQLLFDNPDAEIGSKYAAIQYYMERYSHQKVKMESLFDRIIAMHPEEFSFRELHLSWLLQNGNKDQSKKELRAILDSNPAQEQAWIDFLTLYLDDNSVDTVAAICEEALSYYPENAAFWYYKGLTCLIKEQPDSAYNALLKVPRFAVPGQEVLASTACGDLGDICHQRGDVEQAYDYYKLALAFHPKNASALNNYAYFLCLEGNDLDRAEQMSKLSLQIESNNSTFLDTYAWICYRKGDYTMAKIYIERAYIYLEQPNPEICEHYGDILWACDEKEAAQAEWMKAAALNPNPSESLRYKAEHGEFPPSQ